MFDESGQLIGSRPDVEWDDTERDWMLALEDVRQREESERCHMCGLPKAVCRDKSMERQVKVEFERCYIATAVSELRDSLSRSTSDTAAAPHLEALDFIPELPDPLAGLLDGAASRDPEH